MGILRCACGAEAEGKTFEDADEKIDHGIALSSPGPACSGHPTRMTWDEKGGYDKTGKLIVKNPKPVASQQVVMLVGEEAKDSPKNGDAEKTIASLKDKLAQVGGELKDLKAKVAQQEKDSKSKKDSKDD